MPESIGNRKPLTGKEQLAKAEQIARERHAGQKDKGGNDYILHPRYVAEHVNTDFEKTVAWLHDTMEDTGYTADDMRADGFDENVIACVQLLTHEKHQPYADYIDNLKDNKAARHVKIADLMNNLDVNRLPSDQRDSEDEKRRLDKYRKALATLQTVENKWQDEQQDKKQDSDKKDDKKSPMDKLTEWFKKPLHAWIAVLVAVLAILCIITGFQKGSNPAEIPSNEGFALLKDNKAVEKATVQDTAQTVLIELKNDYTRKSDNEQVGKKVVFGWSVGQRENLGKILDKSKYAKGYEVIGYRSNAITNLITGLLPTFIIVGLFIWIMRSQDGLIGGMGGIGKDDDKAKSDKPDVTFNDVAGEDTALIELKEIKDMLANPEKYEAIGAKLPKGVLLYGPPGTGKTLLAKALAGEVNAGFYYCAASNLIEVFAGLGAKRVRNLFAQAKKNGGKNIIYLDELDAIGSARGNRSDGNSEREQTLNQLLVEMDGFEGNGDIIVLASTNRPDILDKALTRPGRFDRQIGVDLPDMAGREAILRIHARGKTLQNDADLHWAAQNTSGFSGAQLANVMNEAALMAVREGRDAVTIDDISEGIDRTLMGPKKTSREDYKKTLRLTAYHEAGHALAAMATPGADPVNKITILPRAHALGYTAINSDDDRTNYTRSQLFGQLNYMLGGWAAEELVFNDVSTGPSNDIDKATSLARDIITKYGFNDKLGIGVWTFDRSDANQLPLSDETLHDIDVETRNIISCAHTNAVNALTLNRSVLDELAGLLLDKETLTPDDLKPIMAKVQKINPISR